MSSTVIPYRNGAIYRVNTLRKQSHYGPYFCARYYGADTIRIRTVWFDLGPQTRFDFHTFDQCELIIKNITTGLRLDYDTFLELLIIKFDRNEIEHDSIKKFLRNHPDENPPFNAYLNSMDITDVFTTNEKICLEILYRNHFVHYYHTMR